MRPRPKRSVLAKKRFGQHFLEPAWIAKVMRAIDPQPTDRFIEIGPGHGALTEPLLDRVQSVLAIEIDRDLAAALRGAHPHLTILEGDFLELADTLAVDFPVRVAGNLPYNVASPILFKLGELRTRGLPIVDAIVMLQHEVAERLVAEPGGKEYGVLSVLLQYQADVETVLRLPAGAFRPVPKVQSALVRVRFRAPRTPAGDGRVFEGLVQAVFTRRRKTLANALLAFGLSGRVAPGAALAIAGIDGRRRPETLSVDEYVRLSDAYVSASPPAVL